MKIITTEQFMDACSREYFNSFNHKGIPHYKRFTFEQFVNARKLEIERGI